ncbi:PGR5-like protein 1B, chloroplastic [Oryza brachyantha]|nr:PGR5-like protein 1B, chloroplastic [Oryza brachyantha]
MATVAPAAPGAGRLARPRAGLRVGAMAAAGAGEGPSCLFVGPIETASQEMLEALYHQARDSYYSGQPLIVDDMFDKVELKLRVYGSPSVVKYPRCSLKRQSTYADAEEDKSMFMALSSIWMLLFLFGTSAFLVPSLCILSLTFGDAFGARYLLYGAKSFDAITRANDMVLIGLGYLIGYPIASASAGALQGLLTNNLVALKGSCPNCGEQVFAFVKTDNSIKAPHRAECHVCGCPLEYRTKVEKSLSGPRTWVYGRVYLVKQGHPRKRRWLKD